MSTEQELIRDLKEAGVHVSSVWDLVNGPNNYATALPILIRHLGSAQDLSLKEGIARALGVKGFDAAAKPLIEEFKKSNDELYKWAIANSLEIIAPKEYVEELISIMSDERHGRSRQMIAEALGKIRDPRCVPVLIKSLSQDEVAGHVIDALGRVGDKSVIELIEPFTNHKTRWIRTAANTAIKRINKRDMRIGKASK